VVSLVPVKLIHLFLVVGCRQGAELDVALTADDYQVTVDDVPCPVVLLTRTVLSCRLDAYTYIGAHQAAVKVLQLKRRGAFMIFLLCLALSHS